MPSFNFGSIVNYLKKPTNVLDGISFGSLTSGIGYAGFKMANSVNKQVPVDRNNLNTATGLIAGSCLASAASNTVEAVQMLDKLTAKRQKLAAAGGEHTLPERGTTFYGAVTLGIAGVGCMGMGLYKMQEDPTVGVAMVLTGSVSLLGASKLLVKHAAEQTLSLAGKFTDRGVQFFTPVAGRQDASAPLLQPGEGNNVVYQAVPSNNV